jgi:hypothetical protein
MHGWAKTGVVAATQIAAKNVMIRMVPPWRAKPTFFAWA